MMRAIGLGAVLVVLALICVVAVRAAGPGAFAVAPRQARVVVLRAADDGRAVPLWSPRARSLVVFGYTRCADVCPTTLATLSRVDARTPRAARDRILFVDVDPRDDGPRIAAYARRFPGVAGAIGDRRAVRAAEESVGASVTDDLDRHDGRVFVLDRQGVVLAALPPPSGDAQARAALDSLPR